MNRAGPKPSLAALANTSGPTSLSHNVSLPTPLFILLLIIVQLTPSIPTYLRLTTSLAPGTTAVAALCSVLYFAHWVYVAVRNRTTLWESSANAFLFISIPLSLIIIQGCIAGQLGPINFSRFTASLIPLTILLMGGLSLGLTIRKATARQIQLAMRTSFLAFIILVALKLAQLQPNSLYPKSTFPFTETSHFALAFGPIFLYFCASARPTRRTAWVLFGIAFAVLLKSGTLLAFALGSAIINRRIALSGFLIACVFAIGLASQLKYFTSRAEISAHSKNATALVYLQGWELLAHALEETHGLGIGFQQMGLRATNVPAAAAIRTINNGKNLNLKDGGFLMAKFGSEFGAFGLLIVIAYCLKAFQCLQLLRKKRSPPNVMLAASIIFSFGVYIFIRGGGYFTQFVLIFIAAIVTLAPRDGWIRVVDVGERSARLVLH
jgi:hypothetical protein